MGRLLNVTTCCMLLAGLATAGCGGSGSTQSSATEAASTGAPSTQANAKPTPTDKTTTAGTSRSGSTSATARAKTSKKAPSAVALKLSIPGLLGKQAALLSRYTCDGKDISLPLRWSGVPHGTAELVLFVAELNPVTAEGTYSWAVAGLRPTLRGLAAGQQLPAGAVVGRNSAGQIRYTVCPAKTHPNQVFIALLFALPHSVHAKPGFSASALESTMEKATIKPRGEALFTYTRK